MLPGKMTTIHLVSHTHWDREWYLTFQQFRLKLVHMVDHLLDLMDHDPDYRYFLLDGQTILLEDYLEIRPERREDLARQIMAGRISIGPWYVSPDEFLISPESHIRNLLEGDKLCRAFGGKMRVGYLPDDFGHIGQMPQILRGFGIDSACLWRGLGDLPCELDWQALDGSSVLLSNLRDSYSNAASLTTSIPEKFASDVNTLSLSLSSHSATNEVLLMQGTDHMASLDDLARAVKYYQTQAEPNSLVLSTLPNYISSVRSSLVSMHLQPPVVSGELRSSQCSALLQNVLSTRIWLKQRNHHCESELLKWVEPLNAWNSLIKYSIAPDALVTDIDKPRSLTDQQSIIRYAWKLLMQCHPHDSICGTSIDQVINEMRTRFDQVDQINAELVDTSLQNICNYIDTRFEDDVPQADGVQNTLSAVVVFNPNDAPQTGLVDVNIKLAAHYSAYDIIDAEGQVIPADFSGMGSRELISLVLDKKALKQAFRMIHEGHVAGMVVRDFEITRQENLASIRATLSDHGNVNIARWREGVAQMDEMMADTAITEYHIHAFSDPEIKIAFTANDVPQHGYKCYWIRGRLEPGEEAPKPVKLNPVVQAIIPVMTRVAQLPFFTSLLGRKRHRSNHSPKKIENEFFIVEANAPDGTLIITDKLTHQVYPGLNRFMDGGDRGDLYNFCPPERDKIFSSTFLNVVHEEHNSYKELIISSQLKIPAGLSDDRVSRGHDWVTNSVVSTVTLIAGVPRVDIHTEIDNQAHDHRLRVHFPAPFSCEEAMYDGHFEVVQRPIGIPAYDDAWEEPPRPEVPQRLFTSIADDQSSLTIANLGLPEVEVLKNHVGHSEIAITLLRCVGWLSRDDLSTRKNHAGPMEVAVPEAQMVGKFSFDYSIIPGSADWRSSIPHAAAFGSPIKSITTPLHIGCMPSSSSFIKNSNESFVISAIKLPEEGPGLIVRGYNLLSSPIDTSLKLAVPIKHAQLVSLDEQPIQPLPISPDNSIGLHVAGFKIVTLHLLF